MNTVFVPVVNSFCDICPTDLSAQFKHVKTAKWGLHLLFSFVLFVFLNVIMKQVKKNLQLKSLIKWTILSPPLSIFVTFIWFVKNRPTADTEHFEN